MNLKERLEQSSAWVLMSYVAGAFIMGILVTIGFMQVLHQDQPKKQVAEFSIESGKQSETKIEMDKSSISENTENNPIKYGAVFKSGDPIPIGFEQIKIGMRLSVLQSIFPDGEMKEDWYIIRTKGNPIIGGVWCYVRYDDDNMNDGNIYRLAFSIQDSTVRGYLIKRALSEFGTDKAISKMQGRILEWNSVKGFDVKIEELYYYINESSAKKIKGIKRIK